MDGWMEGRKKGKKGEPVKKQTPAEKFPRLILTRSPAVSHSRLVHKTRAALNISAVLVLRRRFVFHERRNKSGPRQPRQG